MKTGLFVQLGIPFVMLAFLGGCSTEPSKVPSNVVSAQPAVRAPEQPSTQPAPRTTIVSTPLSDAKSIPAQRSIYYDFDKSDIKLEGRKLIEAHGQYLREHPAVKIRIEGNADERGSAEYNLALGQRRAEGVAKGMTLLGVPEERIEAVSFGREKPKALGHDEASWAENRRSDIVYR